MNYWSIDEICTTVKRNNRMQGAHSITEGALTEADGIYCKIEKQRLLKLLRCITGLNRLLKLKLTG
jgi:hypothetical protein